jgi:hypothetical protein
MQLFFYKMQLDKDNFFSMYKMQRPNAAPNKSFLYVRQFTFPLAFSFFCDDTPWVGGTVGAFVLRPPAILFCAPGIKYMCICSTIL